VREGLLWLAVRQVTGDLDFIQRTNQWQSYESKCYQEGGLASARQIQLRFLNSAEYVLELGCENYTEVEFQRHELPFSVRKTTGTAGFIFDLRTNTLSGAITLEFLDQATVIEAREDGVDTYWGKTTVVSDNLVSSCEAHGFQCCDSVLEQGQGAHFRTGVNDCQEQCYASCLIRPNLILFQTDPLLDPVARTVEVSKSVPTVFFQYAFGTGSQSVKEVVIRYGDGTEERSSQTKGEFVKQYECQEETCLYRAQIQAVDQSGIPSSVTRIAEVDIVLLDR